MYIIGKLQQHGLKWFIRRVIRELIKPTTNVGQFFKPISPLFYYFISKPANFIYVRSRLKNPSKDTLYFFYDFEIEPITYDFIWALCVANARREELGLVYLAVVFVPGTSNGLRNESPEYEEKVSYDARIWRIYSILIPSIKLLSCNVSMILCATREEATIIREKQARFVYPAMYNVMFPIPYAPEQAIMYRQKLMSLQADHKAKEYVSEWLQQYAKNKKVVVVTLREYGYTPERNSNIMAWAQFANSIDKEKFFIAFVPDTDQDMRGVPDALKNFSFFHPASWNLNLRGALYELAFLNLGVNTGPMSLCWFNPKCRYITFKVAVKNVPQVPLQMITDKGFIPGSNPRFVNQFQKWVWEDDDFDIIVKEFKLMCESIK